MNEDGISFAKNYLHALDTLQVLDRNLGEIGMSSCRELEQLRKAMVEHGAATYRDMYARGRLDGDD